MSKHKQTTTKSGLALNKPAAPLVTKESISIARSNRAAMIRRYGFVPMSVLEIHRGKLWNSVFVYQKEDRASRPPSTTIDRASGTTRSTRASHASQDRKALSIMVPELVDFFAKYYARPGQVYLDPFMGQGIQMQVAKLRGMHYHGYDLSREFFAYIDVVRRKIDDGTTTIRIHNADSRRPDQIPDDIGDFSFHSPPYWDIEYYGDEEGQLGTGQTYDDFLNGMEDVARAWLPKFRVNAVHVVNVNDFRRQGRYYAYHADTIALFQRAGWQLHDTWIIKGLIGGLPKMFAVEMNNRNVAPKVHEYALVFKKP